MTAFLIAALAAFGANAFHTEFDQGNTAYRNGDYAAAVAAYERVIASGAVEPVVFFNLGNAYHQEGRLGPAIANYERALALRPAFGEAVDNRDRALAATANKLPKPLRPGWQQALLFWDTGLTYAASRNLAVATWLAFWGLLAVLLFRRLPYGRPIAVLLCGLAMLSGLSAWCKAHPVSLAVGAVASAPVRFGTSEADEVRFVLGEGDRVAVETIAGDWIRVRSVDGVRGWVRADQVCLTGPPYLPAPTPPVSPAPEAKAAP